MLEEYAIVVESSKLERCVSDSGASSINPLVLVCLLRPLRVAPLHSCWKKPPPGEAWKWQQVLLPACGGFCACEHCFRQTEKVAATRA